MFPIEAHTAIHALELLGDLVHLVHAGGLVQFEVLLRKVLMS